MHTLDIIFIIIAAIFMIIGIKRGMIGEIIRLAAMILGFFIAFLYFKDISVHLPIPRIPLHIKNAISFLLIYIVVALIIVTIGWTIKKLIHLTVLGWIDRIFGATIGLFKTALLAWIVCLSISSFPSQRIENDFGNSYVYRAYKRLPHIASLPGLTSIRYTVKNLFKKNPPEKVKNVQKSLKQIKNVVDSVKR